MQVGCPEARIDENVAKLTAAGYKASLPKHLHERIEKSMPLGVMTGSSVPRSSPRLHLHETHLHSSWDHASTWYCLESISLSN